MKILGVCLHFWPVTGGIENHFYSLLTDELLEPTVITQRARGTRRYEVHRNVRIHRWPYAPHCNFINRILQVFCSLFLGFVFTLRQKPAKIVLSQSLPVGIVGLACKYLLRKEYVVFIHGNDLLRPLAFPITKLALRLVLSNAQYVVANSKFTRDLALFCGAQESKTAIIHPGVDTIAFHPLQDAAMQRQLLGFSGEKIILTVTRLEKRKSIDVCIEAISLLRVKGMDVKYLIVGDGTERKFLENKAKQKNITEHVLFLGRKPLHVLRTLYGIADVFLLPSRYIPEEGDVEGFGIVFAEAAACGIPSIGTNSGGIPDVVRNGSTGVLIDSINAKTVADALEYLLVHNDVRSRMSKRCLEAVRQEFDISVARRKFRDILAGGKA